jgi:hypothetical protein
VRSGADIVSAACLLRLPAMTNTPDEATAAARYVMQIVITLFACAFDAT